MSSEFSFDDAIKDKEEENTIEPVKVRQQEQEQEQEGFSLSGSFKPADIEAEVEGKDVTEQPKRAELPDFVKKNFIEVDGDFYFQNPNKDTNKREKAFTFKDDMLKTRSTSPDVVKALVEIAKSNEWKTLKLSGNKDFRRAVWLEAMSKGMEVSGYTPTEMDKADLKKLAGAGKQFEQENTVSEGEDKTKTQQIETDKKNEELRPVQEQSEAFRKAEAFLNDKPATVISEYPELSKAYGGVSVATKFAQEKLPAEQWKPFVDGVKERYAEMIRKNEPLPAPTVRNKAILEHIERIKTEERATGAHPVQAPASPAGPAKQTPKEQEPKSQSAPVPTRPAKKREMELTR